MTIWYTCSKWGFTLAYAVSFVMFCITDADSWIYVNLVNWVFMACSWFYEWYYSN